MLLFLCGALPAKSEGRLAVIVHPDRDSELSPAELAQIYLKQRRFWRGREAIVPVNRNAGSAARETFTKQVLAERARHLELYWNRQYYHGVLPPLTLASDEAVKRFVALEPKAIGYIAEGHLDDSVRAVLFLSSSEARSP